MQTKKINLEICADSVESAMIAQAAGAYRIEFCDNLVEGGTTHSLANLISAREHLQIKLYPIIRPRGGNFLYSDIEFNIMKEDIRKCGEIGCDGVVIGMLNADGTIDKERSRELVNVAKEYSMGVTFHRAFDRCNDLPKGLEDIIDIGCERVLTSGGKNSALEGIETIRQLVIQAGERIIIMPGGGVSPENIAELVGKTGAREYHGTFKSRFQCGMLYINRAMTGEEQENTLLWPNPEKIKLAIKTISHLL